MAGSDTLTGSWPGRFDDDSVAYGTPVSFDAVLTELGSILHGEVVEPNTFRKDVTPADVYFGRDKDILKQRERIKRKTLKTRRLHHRQHAAQSNKPDEPNSLLG